jgi:hypothetical protein
MRALAAALCCLASGAAACAIDPFTNSDYPASLAVDAGTRGEISRAWYDTASQRYEHNVLGRTGDPIRLWLYAPYAGANCGEAITLDESHVFEDTAPRLADLDGDGTNEAITVRSHIAQGAQVAVYGVRDGTAGLIATTPYIGTRHRWLAPLGAADLDGDGAMEIAFVDRPHLARTLRIWRWENDSLTEVAAATGLTNHRIGEATISGGIRDCGAGPEMILATADWSQVVAVTYDGTAISARVLAAFDGFATFDAAMDCRL